MRLIDADALEKAIDLPFLENIKLGKIINDAPTIEAETTIIRSRTLMPTKDFKKWAKRVKETNPNAVVIPCDAEVVSADAVSREESEVEE